MFEVGDSVKWIPSLADTRGPYIRCSSITGDVIRVSNGFVYVRFDTHFVCTYGVPEAMMFKPDGKWSPFDQQQSLFKIN